MACVHCAESGLFAHIKLHYSVSSYVLINSSLRNSKIGIKKGEKENTILPKNSIIVAKKDSPVFSYSDKQISFFLPKQAKNINENFFTLQWVAKVIAVFQKSPCRKRVLMNDRGQATLLLWLQILNTFCLPRKCAASLVKQVVKPMVKQSLFRNRIRFELELDFWRDIAVRQITQQHGLYDKQKGDTLLSEHFVKDMHTSSSSTVHYLVAELRA